MPFTEDDLCKITTSVWESILGLDLQRCPQPVCLANEPERFMTGYTHITGAWEGTVSVQCAMGLARRAASIMFSKPLESITESEMRDALGELANMIGGNLKTLMPVPSALSLPSVIEGLDDEPMEPLSQITWFCGGTPVRVVVRENQPVPVR